MLPRVRRVPVRRALARGTRARALARASAPPGPGPPSASSPPPPRAPGPPPPPPARTRRVRRPTARGAAAAASRARVRSPPDPRPRRPPRASLPGQDIPPRTIFDSSELNDIAASPETRGYANFASREDLERAARRDRDAIPAQPESKPYQQTLRRSFTLRGIGLHGGEVETVRVCPAFANEGRYFVRVPPGVVPENASSASDEESGAFARDDLTDEETEDLLLDHLRDMMGNMRPSSRAADEEEKKKNAERAEELGAGKGGARESPARLFRRTLRRRRASPRARRSRRRTSACPRLAVDEANAVGTVEHVLSALEACGVDNARIEVEGTGEIPILDGSAYPFTYDVARVGVVPAPSVDAGDDSASGDSAPPRMAWKLDAPITVRGDGGAFVTLHPDDATKLTCGIDFTYKSRAIGKQWESWTPTEDGAYADFIAPARTFATMADVMAYFRAGYIRGGTENCALIAHGDEFWNPPMVLPNEPARHKLLDLIGDLSLLAEPGMAGVPVGHVVAYKAGHELHAKFARGSEGGDRSGRGEEGARGGLARRRRRDAGRRGVANQEANPTRSSTLEKPFGSAAFLFVVFSALTQDARREDRDPSLAPRRAFVPRRTAPEGLARSRVVRGRGRDGRGAEVRDRGGLARPRDTRRSRAGPLSAGASRGEKKRLASASSGRCIRARGSFRRAFFSRFATRRSSSDCLLIEKSSKNRIRSAPDEAQPRASIAAETEALVADRARGERTDRASVNGTTCPARARTTQRASQRGRGSR